VFKRSGRRTTQGEPEGQWCQRADATVLSVYQDMKSTCQRLWEQKKLGKQS